MLTHRNVPQDAIALERLASSTSENFWLTAELLRDLGRDPQTFLIVHKPYAERRTLATARRRWPGKNAAVTSQPASFDDYCAGDIPAGRILSMLAGETLRLETYATAGLIEHQPVPDHLLDAAHELQAAGFSSRPIPAASRHASAGSEQQETAS